MQLLKSTISSIVILFCPFADNLQGRFKDYKNLSLIFRLL